MAGHSTVKGRRRWWQHRLAAPEKTKTNVQRGLFAAFGVVLGISAEKAVDLVLGGYDRLHQLQTEELQRQRDNVKSVIAVWSDEKETSVERKSVYTAVLLQNGMVPEATACSLVAYAMNQTPAASPASSPSVVNTLTRILSPEFVTANFNKDPCNIVAYVAATGATTIEPPKLSKSLDPACPSGTMFTQFGKAEQIAFGRSLKHSRGGFTITAPELVKGFDAKEIAIRTFHEADKNAAEKWYGLLLASFPDLPFSIKILHGYEDRILADQFELWWPASIAVPAKGNLVACQ